MASAVRAGGPADALHAAALDVRKLPPERAYYAKYFDLSNIEAKRLADWKAGFLYHLNNLSRAGDFGYPVSVTPSLWRIDSRDFEWDLGIFEQLKTVEPYYHDKLDPQADLVREEYWPGGMHSDGQFYKRGIYPTEFRAGHKYTVPGVTLPAADYTALVKATYSEIPLVRADWFFLQTAANVDRKAGYYRFLGIKTKADIAELTGLDIRRAQEIYRELAAIIKDSGVALNNRQIYWFNAIAGAYFETRDTKSNTGRQNAIRQLNGDFDPDANEIYFTLRNRLWGYAAADARNGNLQDTVPDFIAHDREATSNDLRIHASISCVRCHVEGLRPIDDYARRFYSIDPARGGALLTSPDFAKFQRLKRLYLGPLQNEVRRASEVYQQALVDLLGPGWTPERVARIYGRMWAEYLDTPVSREALARELGCSVDFMLKAFAAAALAKGANADPVLVGYAKTPPETFRREFVEESFGVMMLAVKGAVPP